MYSKKIINQLPLLVLFLFFTPLGIYEIVAEDCAKKKPNFAVVELFTSEGCSDCPPADLNLAEISQFEPGKNVYALAFHVTYWDYIGWKDPYGQDQFTNRQQNYAGVLRSGNYTPQAIVNGKMDLVGSQRTSLLSAIESELKNTNGANIELSTVRKENTLEISYQVFCANQNQILNLALVEKGLVSFVSKGENRGVTLKHENVVRNFQSVPLFNSSGSLKIQMGGSVSKFKNYELISYLQDPVTFQITGASRGKLE